MKQLPNDPHQAVDLIRKLADEYREKKKITFEESSHKYTIVGDDGVDYSKKIMSVSGAYKKFHLPFPTEEKALKKAKGDLAKSKEIMAEWKAKGKLSTEMGSYVHYHSEVHLWEQWRHKDIELIREPDLGDIESYIHDAEGMLTSAFAFCDLMKDRGAILIDTEAVMGCEHYKLFGQADKFWLAKHPTRGWGLLTTDWKTNDPSKFDVAPWTKNMLGPYGFLYDNELGKYSVQLTMYSALFIKMMAHMGYGLPYLGSIIVNVTPSYYMEYKVVKGLYGVTENVLKENLHLQQWYDPKIYKG
jgi:hypothetical protein